MGILKALLFLFFEWLASYLRPIIEEMIASMKKKKSDEKTNENSTESLEKAKTEDERRNANSDITRDSF